MQENDNSELSSCSSKQIAVPLQRLSIFDTLRTPLIEAEIYIRFAIIKNSSRCSSEKTRNPKLLNSNLIVLISNLLVNKLPDSLLLNPIHRSLCGIPS